jgi:spore maturation protein CgeB
MEQRLRIVIFGLSITSSWGNGHATTYRGLVRGLTECGHDVLFLERDVPWYAGNRDMPDPPYGRTRLYSGLAELKESYTRAVRDADLVIVGSYVPQAVQIGEWVLLEANGVTAFYDIDTPVTLAKIERGDNEYLTRALIMRYDLYLSFTGGPTLTRLEKLYRSPRAQVLYCSVDPLNYFPEDLPKKWDLGYIGTYSEDRQPAMEALMLGPAQTATEKSFVVAGPMFPETVNWPGNVERIEHLPPCEHRSFYNSQYFTLNLTRRDMVLAGYSPSVRLFEAAACGTPIITDYWRGLHDAFEPGREILVAQTGDDTLKFLRETTEEQRLAMSERLRARVLRQHTCIDRAKQLEQYVLDALDARAMVSSKSRAHF